jgi:DNA end-binding protein Ku
MRSMWKGSISFGLVMIPVKLYAATHQRDLVFRQVHAADGGRIRFRRICSVDGAEVEYDEVAKGYELPDGEVVLVTDEDLADLPLPTVRSIEVLNFAPADQLDPILCARSYYLEPEPTGARAYVLLRDALERSGKVAVAKVALRQRESLAALRARDGVLVLETLLWPDEIREPVFPFLDEDIEVHSQELKMAASLISSMTVDFDPSQYRDRYREALEELVAAKIQGRDVIRPGEPGTAAANSGSLADVLRASLAAAHEDKASA